MPIQLINSLELTHSMHSGRVVYSRKNSVKNEQLTLNRKFKGFTLIELLVVITIIGILATLIVASFTSAQRKARDSKRKSDLDAVKKAMELASGDCRGGTYPYFNALSGEVRYNNLAAHLSNSNLNYIKTAPTDPTNPTGANAYNYTPSGAPIAGACPNASGGTISGSPGFNLRTTLENGSDPAGSASVIQCSSSGAIAPPVGTVYYYVCDQ